MDKLLHYIKLFLLFLPSFVILSVSRLTDKYEFSELFFTSLLFLVPIFVLIYLINLYEEKRSQ
jgi:hypothetical protein